MPHGKSSHAAAPTMSPRQQAPQPKARATASKHTTALRQQEERKQRLQTHGRSSMTRSIANAVVIKDGEPFFLSEPNGQVPLQGNHGFGLYYHDCRYLRGYELKFGDVEPDLLAATAERGFLSVEPVTLPLTLIFQAEFEPLFMVRGRLNEKRGKVHTPRWHQGHLCFLYDGADQVYRNLAVYFSAAPQSSDGATAHFQFTLQPQKRQQLGMALCLGESAEPHRAHAAARQHPTNLHHLRRALQDASDRSLATSTEVRSDSLLFNNIVERSLRDLHMLKTSLRGHQFFAAGVPWFVTLFGRDSLTASLQMLAYEPSMAEQTLRLLAHYQGQKVDPWRDEQPGKIMHELRVGELAHLNQIPQTPYYGTVDATPLFLIVLAQHAAWTGTLTVFQELRDNVERALAWLAQSGDQDRDGYVEYRSASRHGLINQGWKDSGDAIVNADCSLATPPIALVEVQGYVYQAKRSLADLFERAGEGDRAAQLRQEAEELRQRFNRDFWLPERGFYALALQAEHKPAAVIASNPGQALWTGIAEPELARQTMARLMADDMFSGWGVRTLSDQERRYNPIGYHLGTVWPHDNALIAAGCRNYGGHAAACRIFTGMVGAAAHFTHHRLPEVFAGFGKHEYGIPVRYPVACHPQAWAAGAIPFLITTCLGLQPDAFAHRLRIVQPVLPDFLQRLTVRRLRVGQACADVQFTRAHDGHVTVEVLQVAGRLVVEVTG